MTTPTATPPTAPPTTASRIMSSVHEATLHLTASRPFDWRQSLDFLARFPATRGEQIIDEGRLVKAWRMSGHTLATRISAGGDGVEVEVSSPHPVGAVLRESIADRLRFYLSLSDDLSPLTVRPDPYFAAVERRLHGYHQVKFPTPVEHIVWAVLSQRTPLAVAQASKHRLATSVNPPLRAFGHDLQPFPSLGELVRVPEGELAEHVRNQRKASYLHRTLRLLTEVDESFLRTAPYEEVERFLLSLPGIGPWSANFVLIRGLGRMDRAPGDAELLRAAEAVYGHPVDADELASLADRYAPVQGYWAHYLRAGGVQA